MPRLISCFLFLVATVAWTQEPTTPPSGSIHGIITSTAGVPIQDATVQIKWADQTANAVVLTDKNGRYSFDELALEKYILNASHYDYVYAVYGPGGPRYTAMVLELHAGQRLEVNLALKPLASISGRVLDGEGEPLAGYVVSAEAFTYVEGVRKTKALTSAVSDDRGVYLMEKIPPGRFYVRARRPAERQDQAPVAMALKPGEADLRWDDTFYPNANDVTSAATVAVEAGQQLTDIDIKMRKRPFFTVRGRVLGFDSSIKAARVLVPATAEFGATVSGGVLPAPDGSFELHGVPSGPATILYRPQVSERSESEPYAWKNIQVFDEDLENVVLDARRALILAPIRYDGTRELDRPIWEVNADTIFWLQAAEGGRHFSPHGEGPDGRRFELPPGRYRFHSYRLPDGAYLKDVRLAGVSMLDSELDTSAGVPDAPLEVIVGMDAGTLTGTVQAKQGELLISPVVTLVPAQRGVGSDRLYRSVNADSTGVFRITGVAPGRYEVFAWERIDDTAHWNEDFLRPFLTRGKVVEIEEGETKSLDLDIISTQEMEQALARAGLQ